MEEGFHEIFSKQFYSLNILFNFNLSTTRSSSLLQILLILKEINFLDAIVKQL